MVAFFALAMLADAVTFVLLPRGGEANPLVVNLGPDLALVAKAALTFLVVMAFELHDLRYRRAVYATGMAAGSLGAITNVLTIWR